MAFGEDLMYYLALAAKGFGGQDPSEMIATRSGAKQAGMSYGDYSASQRQAELERQRIKDEQDRAQLAQVQANIEQTRGENIDAAKKAELESAAMEAKTGVREGDEITQFLSAAGGNPQTMIGTAEEAQASNMFAPGLYMRADNQAEAFARANQEDADNKLFREITKGREDRAASDRALELRSEELDLSRDRYAHDVEGDKLQDRYTRKRIEQIDAAIGATKQGGNKPISTGQAAAIAANVLGDDLDANDEDSIRALTELTHKIQKYDAMRPNEKVEIAGRDSIAKFEARRDLELSLRSQGKQRGAFADDQAEDGIQGDLRGQIEGATQESGEEIVRQQAPPTPPQPSMPAVEGQPDSRWMDESVSFMDLIGANPEVNKKIQEAEMTQDMKRLEWQARHLGSLGYKEAEFPEDVQAFLRTLRNPESVQGLMAQ